MTGFGEAVGLFYRNYVNFEARASRSEFWWVFLMQIIVWVTLFIALAYVIGSAPNDGEGEYTPAAMGLFSAMGLFALINFLPNIALQVRRFHDLDQTGWLVLVFTLANAFILFTWFAQMIWYMVRGTDGPNKYGPDPLTNNADIFG
jgi:uncharacterized membrane protein YhaH (DUF805 family)